MPFPHRLRHPTVRTPEWDGVWVSSFLFTYSLYHFLPFAPILFLQYIAFLLACTRGSGCVYTTVLTCCLFQIQSYISNFLFHVSPPFLRVVRGVCLPGVHVRCLSLFLTLLTSKSGLKSLSIYMSVACALYSSYLNYILLIPPSSVQCERTRLQTEQVVQVAERGNLDRIDTQVACFPVEPSQCNLYI